MKSISIANGLDVHASPVVVVDQKSMDNVTLLAAPEEGATQNAIVVVEEFLESEEFINDRKKKDDSVSSVSMYETFKTLIRHPSKTGNLPLFWLFCLIQGSALSIINNFWFITLVSSLHANQTILSVTNIARIALEVPFFIWCDAVGSVVVRGVKWAVKIVKIGDYRPIENGVNGADLSSEDMEIIGMRWMMVVSMGLLAFRLLMFSVMLMFSWNAWVNVAVELLHGTHNHNHTKLMKVHITIRSSFLGIIYATFYSAAVQIASLSAPENLRTTSQGLFSAIFSGFGACLGSFVGGLIYGALGPIFLFGATLITTIVGIIIYSVDILRSSSRMKKSRPNTEDEAPVAVVVSPLRQRRSLPDISK
jgi:MFS family permease